MKNCLTAYLNFLVGYRMIETNTRSLSIILDMLLHQSNYEQWSELSFLGTLWVITLVTKVIVYAVAQGGVGVLRGALHKVVPCWAADIRDWWGMAWTRWLYSINHYNVGSMTLYIVHSSGKQEIQGCVYSTTWCKWRQTKDGSQNTWTQKLDLLNCQV